MSYLDRLETDRLTLRILCFLLLLCQLVVSGQVAEPRLAVVSDLPGATVELDGESLASLVEVRLDGRSAGGGVIQLPDWEWHKLAVVSDGVRASGPRIVQASTSGLSTVVYLFPGAEEIEAPSVDQAQKLPAIPKIVAESMVADTWERGPEAPVSVPRVHAAEPISESTRLVEASPSPRKAAMKWERPGRINITLPPGLRWGDVVRLVDLDTGDIVDDRVLSGNEAMAIFEDISGSRWYRAELVRDGQVMGSSSRLLLGYGGIWAVSARIKMEQVVRPRPAERAHRPARSYDVPERMDSVVEVVCPADESFASLCAALRDHLAQDHSLSGVSVSDDEIDAYLEAYGYPTGGPALRGRPVGRRHARPVVFGGKVYVFKFRNYKLVRYVRSTDVQPGDGR